MALVGRAWPALLVLWTIGCASAPPRLPDPGPLAIHWRKPAQVVDGFTGSVLSFDGFWAALEAGRVVYVAEQHDRPADHAVQLAVLAELATRDPSLAVGMEMFRRSDQPALDAFVEGGIDEAELRRRTGWETNWGFDYALYRPLLDYARAHGLRILGLNIERAVTLQVARGGLDALDDEVRSRLPTLDLAKDDHRAYVKRAMGMTEGEAHGGLSFDNLYVAQVIWDEVMAESVAQALAAPDAPHRVVVLAGRGHVEYRFGIPERAAGRGAAPYRTVIPVQVNDDRPRLRRMVEGSAGDFLWVMADRPEQLPFTSTAAATEARR
jgi:uncharacterized iron-regulated protein